MKIVLLDVTAAFLHGDCEPALYGVGAGGSEVINQNVVARLIKSLYGTRDAMQMRARHVAATPRRRERRACTTIGDDMITDAEFFVLELNRICNCNSLLADIVCGIISLSITDFGL